MKAAAGLITYNPSCYGFRSAGTGTAVPIWEEIDNIATIFRWFVAGDGEGGPMARGAIARRLMREGIRISVGQRGHKSRDPDYVGEGHITTILRNRMYVGEWCNDGVWRPCPALLVSRSGEAPRTAIPVDLFEAAQAILDGTIVSRSENFATEKRPLAGLLCCGGCGRPLHCTPGHRGGRDSQARWYCSYRTLGLCKSPNYAGYREFEVDEWAQKHLAPVIEDELSRLRAEQKTFTDNAEMIALETRLAHVRQAESKKLTELALSGLDQEQFKMVAGGLRKEREQIEARLADLRRQAANEARTRAPGEIDLQGLSRGAFGAALRKCLRWIAITDKGLIALTMWGTYIAAASYRPTSYRVAGSRMHVLPPGPVATATCMSWIHSRSDFCAGHRANRNTRSKDLSDDEIMPEHVIIEPRLLCA